MANRFFLIPALAAALTAGCSGDDSGPLKVSGIGGDAEVTNPNLEPLAPASAFLLEAAAQGLVRFDGAGEIEPALAQSWIVSDDGLRYTFRLRRTEWNGGGKVIAEQVARRLRAAISPASRNPLKPALQVIHEVEAMTDQVLEISLRAPRPNFLQLLAQPELAILREGRGTGPYRILGREGGAIQLALPPAREEAPEEGPVDAEEPEILLRGERAAMAVARFALGEADLVVGGTAGDLPIARAAPEAANALAFDPVGGLFGLSFASDEGVLADAQARRALSMAIDRQAILSALNVPGLQPRTGILPPGTPEIAEPAEAEWAAAPMAQRRERAARTLASLRAGEEDGGDAQEPLRLRVAVPEGRGYRLVFAHLRRDWRNIGVEAEAVAADAAADLHLIDRVAPTSAASWYLNPFTCERSAVCEEAADELIAAAVDAPPRDRALLLAGADRILTASAVFLPIAAPVRWSLASPRATGFRTNPFARHPAGELIADRP